MSAPATNGWSVNNIMRQFGVNTRTAVHTSWEAGLMPPQTSTTIDIAKVDDGIAYLTTFGFATYNAGTGVITPTHTDANGKPAHLRRVPGNEFAIEYLPNGAPPQDGT